MEKVKLNRDKIRRTPAFRYTNDIWNYLSMNHGWSIGLMMNIVGERTFESFEEWETYYLNSGAEREEALNKLPDTIRKRLKNIRAHYENPYSFKSGLSKKHIDINIAMGRTIKDMELLAEILHDEVIRKGNHHNLSLEDCMNHVYIRIVDELFIGLLRESNTIKSLREQLPELTIKKSNVYIDKKYAIDAEVYHKDKLLCGFQIKSPHFLKGKTNEMINAHNYNNEKMNKYRDEFNTDAFYLYSEVSGKIINSEILKHLTT